MARHRARELPGGLAHLPAYKRPPPDRVRHDTIWQRAISRWRPGTRVTVRFPQERR